MRKIFQVLVATFLLLTLMGPTAWANEKLEWDFDWVVVQMPVANFSAVYLYDLIGKESLVGGESNVLRFPRMNDLQVTVGVVTDGENSSTVGELRERSRKFLGNGTPFIGVHIPVNLEKAFNLGAFFGRNSEEGKSMAGIKCTVKFW